MYSNERNINWLDILFKVVFLIVFVLLMLWLFQKMPNMTAFNSGVFRENIKYMQEAGESYFTNERMPSEVGASVKLTLQEMIDKSLILPFVDKDGNSCNVYSSYVEITKQDGEYSLKTNLVCNTEQNYVMKVLGCYDYCDSCNEKEISKLEYQFKKGVTNTFTSYSCPSGYVRNGKYCYKYSKVTINATATSTETERVYTPALVKSGTTTYYCPSGYTALGSGSSLQCYKTVTTESSCPSGYTKSGSTCYKLLTYTPSSTTTYSCPSGYTKSGSTCTKSSTVYAEATATTTYTCPSGYTKNGSTCYKASTVYANPTTTGTTYGSWVYSSSKKSTTALTPYTNETSKMVYVGTTSEKSCSTCYTYITYYNYTVYTRTKSAGSTTCPSGYTKSGSTCAKTSYTYANPTSSTTYACPSGYTKSGSTCYKTTTSTIAATPTTTTEDCASGYEKSGSVCYKYLYDTVTCPSGYSRSGSTCYKYSYTDKLSSTGKVYYCPSSYTALGSGSSLKCYKDIAGTTTYSCPSGYTKNGKKCYKTELLDKEKATTKTSTSKSYRYTWSESKTLKGWTATGKTRTVTSEA